jgi:hypothetical protein
MAHAQKPDFVFRRKRTSPFKSAEASVQSTTGSRGVRISGSNAGYTMFRGSVKGTGYPLHSPVSPSLPLPCVTVCHHISTGLYLQSRCLQNTTPYAKTTRDAQNNSLYNCILFDIPLTKPPTQRVRRPKREGNNFT